LQHRAGYIETGDLGVGKARAQSRQPLPVAAADIERAARRQLDYLHPFLHALSNFAQQEIKLAEPGATAVKGKPGQPRGRQPGIWGIGDMQGHGQTGRNQWDRQAVRQSVAPPERQAASGGPTKATGTEVYAPARPLAGRARGVGHRVAQQVTHLWSVLLPSACLICARVQCDVVCAGCTRSLLRTVPRCPRCAMPGTFPRHCDACACDDPIDATLTLGDYAEPFDRLVLRLKFAGRLPAAGWIATQLAARVHASGCTPDVLVPVPLAPARLAERGFNQAWEIAHPLARLLGIAASPTLLARPRDTVSQRALDLSARQANLQDAFVVAEPHRLDGLHVGLVDDVMTTGATLREAARVLKAHGAARVTALPALRTP